MVSASKIANQATRNFAEKTGVAYSGTIPTMSYSFVTSLKYALTTRAAAGLSWFSRPRSRKAVFVADTPKPADAAVLADPLLRDATSNHTLIHSSIAISLQYTPDISHLRW
jgi:hypothetical protein